MNFADHLKTPVKSGSTVVSINLRALSNLLKKKRSSSTKNHPGSAQPAQRCQSAHVENSCSSGVAVHDAVLGYVGIKKPFKYPASKELLWLPKVQKASACTLTWRK